MIFKAKLQVALTRPKRKLAYVRAPNCPHVVVLVVKQQWVSENPME